MGDGAVDVGLGVGVIVIDWVGIGELLTLPKLVLKTVKSNMLIIPSGLTSALGSEVPNFDDIYAKSIILTMPSQELVSPGKGHGGCGDWA